MSNEDIFISSSSCVLCFVTRRPRFFIKGNVRVYIGRMLMSARYYSIAHAYKSTYEIHLQFVLIL